LTGLFENYLAFGGVEFSAKALAELVTLIALVASFVLFALLAVRFRHSEGGILGSFKLQFSIAILVWIIGEIFEYMKSFELGMYIHTCSMALFALFLLYRVRGLLGK